MGRSVGLGSSPDSGGMDRKQFLSEMSTIQKAAFDQASNYTKLVVTLGYAGFLAVWSGTKATLHPIELVGSALLICLSLIVFIAFEIYQARFISIVSINLMVALSKPETEAITALEEYKAEYAKMLGSYVKLWKWSFPFSAVTGILGGLITH